MLFITASLLMLRSPISMKAPYKAAASYLQPRVWTGEDAELLGLGDVLVPLSTMAGLLVSQR